MSFLDPARVDTAIVRPPPAGFARGLTTAGLGAPDPALAGRQHARYVAALEDAGLRVITLPPDERYPDSTFVEDAAVVVPRLAVLARPGAPSRRDEATLIEPILRRHFAEPGRIGAPGTLDGGDVCAADDTLFIGLSERTNDDGARALERYAARAGYRVVLVPLGGDAALLHLKSGLAWLGGRRLAIAVAWQARAEFAGFELLPVAAEDTYAANCLRVNDTLLVAAGFPRFEEAARRAVERVVTLDVSEFRRMDGGLSCLSLRWAQEG